MVAKGGPKLKPAAAAASTGGVILKNGLRQPNASMEVLAGMLARPTGRPVADRTGIQGRYDIVLEYVDAESTDSRLPSIFTAVREQLGLRLEKQKVPVQPLVIDHVDKVPLENSSCQKANKRRKYRYGTRGHCAACRR